MNFLFETARCAVSNKKFIPPISIAAGFIGKQTLLRPFYRGWSGLEKYAQIVEREIWMQRGWEWLDYRKSGQILAQDTTHDAWDADWADVRIEFASADGRTTGAYEARVEAYGSVMTAYNSGEGLVSVKQYRVKRLEQVVE